MGGSTKLIKSNEPSDTSVGQDSSAMHLVASTGLMKRTAWVSATVAETEEQGDLHEVRHHGAARHNYTKQRLSHSCGELICNFQRFSIFSTGWPLILMRLHPVLVRSLLDFGQASAYTYTRLNIYVFTFVFEIDNRKQREPTTATMAPHRPPTAAHRRNTVKGLALYISRKGVMTPV